VKEAARQLAIAEQTYYRWRREYGGMDRRQARYLKELERENTRLKRLVADLALDKAILEEALSKKRSARPGGVNSWTMSRDSSAYPSGEPAGHSANRVRRSAIARWGQTMRAS
jgi:hypothetical protein